MKIKFFYILILLTIISWKNVCGNNLIDSLKNRIKFEQNDASKAMLLIKLSDNFGYNSPDSMLKYAELGYETAVKAKFNKGQFLSLYL